MSGGFVIKPNDSELEIQTKIVLVGDAGVGKSCFMKRFVDSIRFTTFPFFRLSSSSFHLHFTFFNFISISFHLICQDAFAPQHVVTIGVDYVCSQFIFFFKINNVQKEKTFERDNIKVKLQLWVCFYYKLVVLGDFVSAVPHSFQGLGHFMFLMYFFFFSFLSL